MWDEIQAQEATGELLAAWTVEAWWPQILAFGITNARTEATNRMIKDAARIAFGFRSLHNQRRQVRLHCKRTILQG